MVVVMLLAGAAVAYVLTRDEDEQPGDRTARRTGDLTIREAGFGTGLSLLSEPGDTWFFVADDAVPGGRIGYQPLVIDDIVLATIEDEDYSTLEFVAVEADSGDVRWRKGPEDFEWCDTLDDRELVCGRGDRSGVDLVDLDTGDAVRGFDVRNPWWVTAEGGTVYVGAALRGRFDYHTRLAALDRATFVERWTVELTAGGGSEDHDSSEVESARGELYIKTGPTGWRLSPSGQVLSSFSTQLEESVEEGYRYKYGPTIRNWDRSVAVRGRGSTWDGPDGLIVDGRVGIGDSLYDTTTGAVVWTAPPEVVEYGVGDYGFSWAPGNEQVLVEGPYDDYGETGGTALLDAADGTFLWETDDALSPYTSVFTDDAIANLVNDYEPELVVRSLADGEPSWRASLAELDPDLSDYDEVDFIGVTARSLVAGSTWGLMGFTEFGPGDGADERADIAADGGGEDGTSYTTACGSPPEFVPVEAGAANGGVTITYQVRAVCPGGQWLNHSQLWVPLVVDGDGVTASSGTTYADGYFDFSSDPYWIPDDGVTLTLVYPYTQTAAPVEDIASVIADDGGSGEVVFVPCEPGPGSTDGPVPPSPEYGADPEDPAFSASSPDETDTPEQRDESALEALRRIAAEDLAAVEQLEWTAQLSSKQPGTYDDGMVYDSFDDILALHLRLRAQYPGSLLLFSTDWRGTYGPTSRDYWVTISGASEPTTRPVLSWCRAAGRDDPDCWAVRPRRSGDPDRNVDHAPPDARNN